MSEQKSSVVGENGVSTAEGQYSDGKVLLNAAMPAERLTGYLIKHELTHSIEGTKQWAQLEEIVRSYYGDAAFEEAKTEVMRRYAANNTQLTPEGAAREVVAQWVGENLFRDGFAQAIASGDASVGNAFLQTLDKIRLALGGTKNSRTAGNIALVERLFMRALEGSTQKNTAENRSTSYSLRKGAENDVERALKDKNYTEDVYLTESSPSIISSQKGVRNLPMLMKASHIRENVFTEQEAKKIGLKVDSHTHYHGLGKDLFLRIIDGLDDVKLAYRGTKNASDPIRRENYFLLISEYKDANKNVVNVPVYIDEKGQYNRVFIDTNKIATVFGRSNFNEYINREIQKGNLVRIKNKSTQASELTALIADSYSKNASTDTTVAQNSFGVNSYDMPNAEKNSQYSFSSENDVQNTLDTINSYVDDEDVAADTKAENSQAIPNLEDTPDADTVMDDNFEKSPEQMQREQDAAEGAIEKEKLTKRQKKSALFPKHSFFALLTESPCFHRDFRGR